MKNQKPKPNGRPDGMFVISIDDGYVEYSYDMNIGGHHSIEEAYKKIRKAFNAKKSEGVMRRSHV